MAYTLATVRTDIKDRLRNSNYTDALVDQYINDAQRDLTNRYKFRFMSTSGTQATSASDYDYDLPTDFSQMKTVRITSPTEDRCDLTNKYITEEEYDNKHPVPTADSEQKPYEWTISGTQILLYPVPDAAYTLAYKYYKKATTLSDDSDVPEIPEEFQEVLILGALIRILKADDMYDEAQRLEGDYSRLVEDMVNRSNIPQVGSSNKIAISRTRTRGGL